MKRRRGVNLLTLSTCLLPLLIMKRDSVSFDATLIPHFKFAYFHLFPFSSTLRNHPHRSTSTIQLHPTSVSRETNGVEKSIVAQPTSNARRASPSEITKRDFNAAPVYSVSLCIVTGSTRQCKRDGDAARGNAWNQVIWSFA